MTLALPAPQRGRDAAALRPMLPLTPPPAVALLTVFAARLIFKDRGVLPALSLRLLPSSTGSDTVVLTAVTVGSVAAASEVATDTLTDGALVAARTTGAVGVGETGHSATQPCPAKLAVTEVEKEAGSRAKENPLPLAHFVTAAEEKRGRHCSVENASAVAA